MSKSRLRKALNFSGRGGHGRCVQTGKVQFREKADASAAAVDLGVRTYLCEFCDQWHLTSQPKRGRAA